MNNLDFDVGLEINEFEPDFFLHDDRTALLMEGGYLLFNFFPRLLFKILDVVPILPQPNEFAKDFYVPSHFQILSHHPRESAGSADGRMLTIPFTDS